MAIGQGGSGCPVSGMPCNMLRSSGSIVRNNGIMRTLGSFAIVILLFVHSLGADDRVKKLSPDHRKWLEEEVVYIITDREKDVFLSLDTVEERDRFIEAFWEKRDPDPLTTVNEFKEEHYKRFEYANRIFGRDSTKPGWKTDRGHYYIILGKPQEIQSFDGSNDVVSSELWFYNGETKYGLPPRFNLLFFRKQDVGDYDLYDPLGDGPEALVRAGSGPAFRLNQNLAVDTLEITSMELAKASLTIDLTEPVADFLSARNTKAPISTLVRPPLSVERVISDINTYPQRRVKTDYLDAYLRYKDQVSADYSFRFVPSRQYWAVFIGPEDTPFVHYSVELDPENFALQSNEDGTKFYTTLDVSMEVHDAAGNLAAVAENSPYIELTPSQMDVVARSPFAYHDDFPLLPGDYHLNLVVKNRATRQFTAAERELHVEPVPAGPSLVGLVLGYKSEIVKAETGQQVFQPGGEIVYPSVDASFIPSDTLYVLVQTSKAPPGGLVRVTLARDQANVLVRELPLAESEGDSVVGELPLVGLETGNYEVRAELVDPSATVLAEEKAGITISPRTQISRAGFVVRHSFNSGVPGLLALAKGQQYLAEGRLAEAEESFSQAVAAGNPQLVMANWKLANVLLYSRRADDALKLVVPLEDSYGQEPDVVDTLGLAYYMKGDFPKAVSYLERSITLRPPQSPLLNALADAYQNLGDVKKAKAVFERSLALNPEQQAVKDRLASLGKSP
jgi:GWxTD domain-containing protein